MSSVAKYLKLEKLQWYETQIKSLKRHIADIRERIHESNDKLKALHLPRIILLKRIRNIRQKRKTKHRERRILKLRRRVHKLLVELKRISRKNKKRVNVLASTIRKLNHILKKRHKLWLKIKSKVRRYLLKLRRRRAAERRRQALKNFARETKILIEDLKNADMLERKQSNKVFRRFTRKSILQAQLVDIEKQSPRVSFYKVKATRSHKRSKTKQQSVDSEDSDLDIQQSSHQQQFNGAGDLETEQKDSRFSLYEDRKSEENTLETLKTIKSENKTARLKSTDRREKQRSKQLSAGELETVQKVSRYSQNVDRKTEENTRKSLKTRKSKNKIESLKQRSKSLSAGNLEIVQKVSRFSQYVDRKTEENTRKSLKTLKSERKISRIKSTNRRDKQQRSKSLSAGDLETVQKVSRFSQYVDRKTEENTRKSLKTRKSENKSARLKSTDRRIDLPTQQRSKSLSAGDIEAVQKISRLFPYANTKKEANTHKSLSTRKSENKTDRLKSTDRRLQQRSKSLSAGNLETVQKVNRFSPYADRKKQEITRKTLKPRKSENKISRLKSTDRRLQQRSKSVSAVDLETAEKVSRFSQYANRKKQESKRKTLKSRKSENKIPRLKSTDRRLQRRSKSLSAGDLESVKKARKKQESTRKSLKTRKSDNKMFGLKTVRRLTKSEADKGNLKDNQAYMGSEVQKSQDSQPLTERTRKTLNTRKSEKINSLKSDRRLSKSEADKGKELQKSKDSEPLTDRNSVAKHIAYHKADTARERKIVKPDLLERNYSFLRKDIHKTTHLKYVASHSSTDDSTDDELWWINRNSLKLGTIKPPTSGTLSTPANASLPSKAHTKSLNQFLEYVDMKPTQSIELEDEHRSTQDKKFTIDEMHNSLLAYKFTDTSRMNLPCLILRPNIDNPLIVAPKKKKKRRRIKKKVNRETRKFNKPPKICMACGMECQPGETYAPCCIWKMHEEAPKKAASKMKIIRRIN